MAGVQDGRGTLSGWLPSSLDGVGGRDDFLFDGVFLGVLIVRPSQAFRSSLALSSSNPACWAAAFRRSTGDWAGSSGMVVEVTAVARVTRREDLVGGMLLLIYLAF